MKKTISILMTSTIILSACGNDKIDQLEQKKSTLKKENRKAKQEITDLENKNQTYKQKEKTLENSIKNKESQVSSQFSITYLRSSTQFINETRSNISEYNKINDDLTDKLGDENIKKKIENIYTNQKTISNEYKNEMKGKEIPEDFKSLHKNMESLSKNIENVFKDLKEAYEKKDKKKIEESINKLNGLKDEIGQIK